MTDKREPFEVGADYAWVKVWLGFGQSVLEPEDQELAEQNITQIFDRVIAPYEENLERRLELLKQFQQMAVTVEDFEEFCRSGFDADRRRLGLEDEPAQVVEVPEAELLREEEEDPTQVDAASVPDLSPEESAEREGLSFLELIRKELAEVTQQHQGSAASESLETSAEELVASLRQLAEEAPEILVVEHDEVSVNLYLLTHPGEGAEEPRLVQLNEETGELYPGLPLDQFLEKTMETLPPSTWYTFDEEDYQVRGPVTYLGEELVLDPAYPVAALLEIPAQQLLWKFRESGIQEPVMAVPETEDWTLVLSSAQNILDLLKHVMAPAVIAQTTATSSQLSFIMPGSAGHSSEVEEGSWAERLTRLTGTYNDSENSGAVVTLFWGADKEIFRPLPQDTEAFEKLWDLPGLLPEPLLGLQKSDEVESLAWIYGLDEGETRRLAQYVEDSDAEIGMESVLQLLDISPALLHLATGRKEATEFEGARLLTPEMSLPQAVAEAIQFTPKPGLIQGGNPLLQNPWLFVAEGAVNLGLSGLLAVHARRQSLRGEPARASGSAAAVFAALGLADIALSLAKSQIKVKEFGVFAPSVLLDRTPQEGWFQNLKEEVAREKNREAGIVHTSETPRLETATGVVRRVDLDPASSASNSRTQARGEGEEIQPEQSLAEAAKQKAKDAASRLFRRFF